MPSDLRTYLESRAEALSDVSTLTVESLGQFGDYLTLRPHNEASLGVYLFAWATGTYQIAFDHEYAIPDEDPRSTDDVDFFLNLARSGGVRMLARPGRAAWQQLVDGEYVSSGTYIQGRGLLVLPGWQHRAELIQFEPWTDPT